MKYRCGNEIFVEDGNDGDYWGCGKIIIAEEKEKRESYDEDAQHSQAGWFGPVCEGCGKKDNWEPWPENKIELAQLMIEEECDRVKALLLSKNAAYGNSALEPRRLFSSADSLEQIWVRIDDKLNRLETMRENRTDTPSKLTGKPPAAVEDTELDLIGYFVLARIARQWKSRAYRFNKPAEEVSL